MPRANSSGRLRERIRVERREEVSDGAGNYVGQWVAQAGLQGLPARITPLRGSEKILADRISGIVIYEIAVRETDATRAIQASDRIVNETTGQTFNVGHPPVNPDQKGRWLVMQCTEGGADG